MKTLLGTRISVTWRLLVGWTPVSNASRQVFDEIDVATAIADIFDGFTTYVNPCVSSN
jgi:hypothetical protein